MTILKSHTERLKAKMDGAKCALEKRKIDANPYHETDELHFEWLSAWADTRLQMMFPREPGKKHDPCPGCVDFTKGPMSDRRCAMCNYPNYEHFKPRGFPPHNDQLDTSHERH